MPTGNRKTSRRVGSEASKVLRSKAEKRIDKSVAGSALSQRAPKKRR